MAEYCRPGIWVLVPVFRLQNTQRALVAKELKEVNYLGFHTIRNLQFHHHLINRGVAVEAVRPFCRVEHQIVLVQIRVCEATGCMQLDSRQPQQINPPRH
jgi:hypothetical protein